MRNNIHQIDQLERTVSQISISVRRAADVVGLRLISEDIEHTVIS